MTCSADESDVPAGTQVGELVEVVYDPQAPGRVETALVAWKPLWKRVDLITLVVGGGPSPGGPQVRVPRRSAPVRAGRGQHPVQILAFVALVVFGGVSFLAYVGLKVLMAMFWQKVLLARKGVRTKGVCSGYTSGRYGSGVVVDFTDELGGSNRMVAAGWQGVLPERGGEVEIVYLPRDPKAADLWPVGSLVPNAIYMTVAVPVILASGLACLVAMAWLVHRVWFPG